MFTLSDDEMLLLQFWKRNECGSLKYVIYCNCDCRIVDDLLIDCNNAIVTEEPWDFGGCFEISTGFDALQSSESGLFKQIKTK